MNDDYKIRALEQLRPGAEWTIRGDELEWLDSSQSCPSEDEIEKEIEKIKLEEPIEEARESRRIAYVLEADPLFFKAQRGEATIEEWQEKIEEIKQRYPL